MFLPVYELSHFISFLPPPAHPTNVRLDAIFHNLEKLWRGTQNPFGGYGTPVPPFDDGPAVNHMCDKQAPSAKPSPSSMLTYTVITVGRLA